jgi:hypothetical protein
MGHLGPLYCGESAVSSSWLSYDPSAWKSILGSGSEPGSDDTDMLIYGRENDGIQG